ncbi:MAG: DUF763 domain-containing protein [Thermoplasmata archaeon]
MRTGIADLPLHGGRAPRWLFPRMVALGGAIAEVIVHEWSREVLLERLADPFWLQCYGNVLGWDWDSSGMGPVVLGALKEALRHRDVGLSVAGGKGRVARRSPDEIRALGAAFGLRDGSVEALVRASKLSAKVDSAAVQDQHRIYHHAFVLSEDGSWTVIQQGMNPERGMARRYHWYWREVSHFDEEPHAAILGETLPTALDMTARGSRASRGASVELAREDPRRIARFLRSLREPGQSSLRAWTGEEDPFRAFAVPQGVNWEALGRTYEFQPESFEELLGVRGIGPATVRALAYISAVIYGEEPSWSDPVRYSFALGGKDGVPYPVNREAMDETTHALARGIEEARLGSREKLRALQRLRALLPQASP